MNAKAGYDCYKTPEALACDLEAPPAVRRQQLAEWAEDLNSGLRASDESMTSAEPGRAGALLQRVMACLALMEQGGASEGRV